MVKNKIVIITQARIGSSRFPEKVLKKLGNSTLLGTHLQRLKRSKKAHKNKALVIKAQALLADANMSMHVTFEHVKAHSGDQFNDLADALAKRGATGDKSGCGERWA